MKFSCVILICPFVVALTMAVIQFTHTTFDSCDPDEWIMTNITFNWINDTKIITSNITYKEANNSKIYRIHYVINKCKNDIICTGEPIVSIDNINCEAQNLSESDMDVCKIAYEWGNLKKGEEFMKDRYGLIEQIFFEKRFFDDFVVCVKINTEDLLWNGTEFK